MNIFDYVILALLAIGGLTGFRKGLITGLARVVGKLAAIGIAVVFHTKVLHVFEPVTDLKGLLESKIGSFLTAMAASRASFDQVGGVGTLMEPLIAEAAVLFTDYFLKVCSLLLLFFMATIIINFLISLIITPLAKTLSLLNRGGGFVFGSISVLIVLCLVIGLIAPFLAATDLLYSGSSLFYPWLAEGYEVIRNVISTLAGDALRNPLEALPAFSGLLT